MEPIYLQSETSAYPELRLVVIMHNDDIAYAPTFAGALQKMLNKTAAPFPERERAEVAAGDLDQEAEEADTTAAETISIRPEQLREASEAFQDYLRYTGEKDYGQAAEALGRLEEKLKGHAAGKVRKQWPARIRLFLLSEVFFFFPLPKFKVVRKAGRFFSSVSASGGLSSRKAMGCRGSTASQITFMMASTGMERIIPKAPQIIPPVKRAIMAAKGLMLTLPPTTFGGTQ